LVSVRPLVGGHRPMNKAYQVSVAWASPDCLGFVAAVSGTVEIPSANVGPPSSSSPSAFQSGGEFRIFGPWGCTRSSLGAFACRFKHSTKGFSWRRQPRSGGQDCQGAFQAAKHGYCHSNSPPMLVRPISPRLKCAWCARDASVFDRLRYNSGPSLLPGASR
jgi:hypothetical protein